MSRKNSVEYPVAQAPLIIRAHRLMEAFAKSDDERDFYVDKVEGFIVYVNLDCSEEELVALNDELKDNPDRYCPVPKLTFYETKKIMEGFVQEKVYDIDTKEKLLDIIGSKEARENFLEFICDHHSELEKWQQYYQERFRIRLIEWLRKHHFHFVFEEDLDMPTNMVERLKDSLFDTKAGKEVLAGRKLLAAKAKTYYSNEALNPRPKRGRPPKVTAKVEVEAQVSSDLFTKVPPSVRPFLFIPEIANASAVTFSTRFSVEEDLFSGKKIDAPASSDPTLAGLNEKLATLRQISSKWTPDEDSSPVAKNGTRGKPTPVEDDEDSIDDWSDDEDDEDEDDEDIPPRKRAAPAPKKAPAKAAPPVKAAPIAAKKAPPAPPAKKAPIAKVAPAKPVKAAPAKAAPVAKKAAAPAKKAAPATPKKSAPVAKPAAKAPKVTAEEPKRKRLMPLRRTKGKK